MADFVEQSKDITIFIKFQLKQRIVTGHHGGFNVFFITEQQFCTRFRGFGRANVRQNAVRIEHPLDQHFNLAAADLTAKHAGRDHTGIVKYQQIARQDFIENIGEHAVR